MSSYRGGSAAKRRPTSLVRTATWPEPVRESDEVGLVARAQYLGDRTLDDFVFERGNSERSLASVGTSSHSRRRRRDQPQYDLQVLVELPRAAQTR